MTLPRRVVPFLFALVVVGTSSAAETPKDANDFKRTDVVPAPTLKFNAERNQIYCDTMAHAWNVLGEVKVFDRALPLKLKGQSNWSDALNDVDPYFFDVPSPDRFAMAGMKKDDIVDKINQGLQGKFGSDAPKVAVNLLRPDDILAYAYLFKNLEFAKPFEDVDLDYWDEKTHVPAPIKSFGIGLFKAGSKGQASIASQIRIHDSSYSHTVVELRPKDYAKRYDTIILLKVNDAKPTLKEMIDEAVASVKGDGDDFVPNSGLRVPVIGLNIRKNYAEMVKPIVHSDYSIAAAIHDIKFVLNKEGALLKSSGTIMVTRGGGPRNYQFDPPFLVILAQKTPKGLKAYFAAWIANDELLEPAL
ncbi:MAG: hypothetical protein V1495_09375 [Pseudomonadota bacterium]